MSHKKRRPRYRFSQLHVMSKHKISDRMGTGTVFILAAAFAPLLDSVFLSAAASGHLTLATPDGIWSSIIFGAACFSGGGAVAGTLMLTGTLRRRLLSVLGVYLTIGLGMLAELGILAWTPWQPSAAIPVVGAFVLLALATAMMGWRIHLQPFTMLIVLLGFTIALSLSEDISADRAPEVAMRDVVAGSVLALGVGFVVTLTAALLSLWLVRWLDPVWITKAGAVSIATIALNELGLPVPSELTIGVLIAGAVMPPVLHTRIIRRLRCWPRARRIYQTQTTNRPAALLKSTA